MSHIFKGNMRTWTEKRDKRYKFIVLLSKTDFQNYTN